MVTKGLYFDSATLYYRSYYAVPESIVAPDGTPSGALRGFLDMVSTLVEQFPSSLVVFAWDDDWRPQWRVDLLNSYKAHRVSGVDESGETLEEVPDTLSEQIYAIAEILDAIGLPRIGESGFEADDILGSLVAQIDAPADIVTGDRDLLQLVNDLTNTRVLSITKGLKKLETFDDSAMRDKYGISGSEYVDFSVLRGDPSDGLPGVKGIGEKTAANLVKQFGSIQALLSVLSDESISISPSVRRNLLESVDYLERAKQVVTLRRDAHLKKNLSMPTIPKNPVQVRQLTERWGIARQVDRLLKAFDITAIEAGNNE